MNREELPRDGERLRDKLDPLRDRRSEVRHHVLSGSGDPVLQERESVVQLSHRLCALGAHHAAERADLRFHVGDPFGALVEERHQLRPRLAEQLNGHRGPFRLVGQPSHRFGHGQKLILRTHRLQVRDRQAQSLKSLLLFRAPLCGLFKPDLHLLDRALERLHRRPAQLRHLRQLPDPFDADPDPLRHLVERVPLVDHRPEERVQRLRRADERGGHRRADGDAPPVEFPLELLGRALGVLQSRFELRPFARHFHVSAAGAYITCESHRFSCKSLGTRRPSRAPLPAHPHTG